MAQASWLKLIDLSENPLDDEPRAVSAGGEDLVILRYGETYFAMDRWCPHQ